MTKRSPRLIFTEEERALPELERAVRKADRAAVKLEKAEAKIPKKTVKVKKRVVDSESGKVTTRLFFEEADKKRPPSKLAHAARKAPLDTVRSAVHHGQVTGGDALILQQLFKNHTRNAARKINKVIVVLHLLQKGGIRQKAAVFAVIAGKCLFNADGKIFIKVSIQLHRPVRKHRFRCAGIQNM